MDGGRRQDDLGRDELLLPRDAEEHRDTERGMRLFEGTELIGDGLRQGPRVPSVAPGTRLERVEASAAIGVEPIPDRLRGDASAGAAGDLIVAIGFRAELRVQGSVAGRQMQEIGDQAVAK